MRYRWRGRLGLPATTALAARPWEFHGGLARGSPSLAMETNDAGHDPNGPRPASRESPAKRRRRLGSRWEDLVGRYEGTCWAMSCRLPLRWRWTQSLCVLDLLCAAFRSQVAPQPKRVALPLTDGMVRVD